MVNISIIVPVYNVEKYLVRCLDSIFNQKFKGIIEVIAVDDCSTDNSLELLEDYQNKVSNLIIVKHEINKRLAQARTSGMRIAKGQYIMHVDSDDWLLPNSLEEIYTKCIETNADVLMFDYLIEDEMGKQTIIKNFTDNIITTNKEIVQKYFFGSCWTKIVKNELTKEMIYSKTEAPRSTEDLIYCTEILLRAKTIYLLPKKFYGYFINSNSITQTTNSLKYLKNQKIIANNLFEIYKEYKPTSIFMTNLLNYFDKWLFLAVAKTQYYNKDLLSECKSLLNEILEVGLLDKKRVYKLRKATSSKYYSLLIVAKRFNLKMALGILVRSFKKN